VTARLAFDPPLPSGEAVLEVTVVIADVGKNRPEETRTLALGPVKTELLVAAAATAPAPPESADQGDAGVSAPDASLAPAPPATSAAPPRRSGCGCELEGASRPSGAPALALLALASLAIRRQNGRRLRHREPRERVPGPRS
jgi:MYXO-CTERM domain-containing protein